MGLFNNLMSKIFGASASTASGATAQPAQPQSSAPAAASGTSGGGAGQTVDVAAVLDGLAAKSPEKLDWKHSIVDLMKLVGLDSSFSARKQLAAELALFIRKLQDS